MTILEKRTPSRMGGGWPLIGHAHHFLRDPVAMLERGYREHGRVFSMRLGGKNAVVLLGPEYHQFFFHETDKLLSIREAYPFFNRMFHQRLYFFAEPAEYQEQRRLLLPRFQGRQMRGYVEGMVDETFRFMEKLGERGEFDLTSTLGPLVMHIAARAFLGKEFRDRLGDEFFDIFREFSHGIDVVLPNWLPLPKFRKSLRAKTTLHNMIRDMLRERRRAPQDPPDFLQTLLESQYSDGQAIHEDVLINLVMLLVWAGHETTVGHTSWALADILQHPGYQDWLQEERDAVLHDATEMTLTETKQLKRMFAALKETERLHPVAFILMRAAKQDISLERFMIPKGSFVVLSPWLSHRLPEIFHAPHQYKPERFLPPYSEDKQTYSLIGFGGGTHRCAGVNFAYLEMKVILTLLLQHYHLSLVGQPPDPIQGPGTRWPQSPCMIRYQRRKPLHRIPLTSSKPAEATAPATGCPFH